MKKKDIRGMNPEEVKSKIAEMQRELNIEYGTRATAGGKSRNYGKIRTLRRMIARMYTATRAKELGINVGKVEKPAATKTASGEAAKVAKSVVKPAQPVVSKPASNKKD